MSCKALLTLALAAGCSAFRLPSKVTAPLQKVGAAATAAAITFHSEAAHAKSVLGINGALDFGPLAGDQPGGEGTGKALGINDDSLFFVLFGVVGTVFFAFSQWQDYQDDDEDYFDAYDSRRSDKDRSNRNRDDGGRLGEITGRSIF